MINTVSIKLIHYHLHGYDEKIEIAPFHLSDNNWPMFPNGTLAIYLRQNDAMIACLTSLSEAAQFIFQEVTN